MGTVVKSAYSSQTWYNMRLLNTTDADKIWTQLSNACQSSNLSTKPTIRRELLGFIQGPNNEKYVVGFLQSGGNANYNIYVNSRGDAEGFSLSTSNRGTISSSDEIVIDGALSSAVAGSYYTLNLPNEVINGVPLPPIT